MTARIYARWLPSEHSDAGRKAEEKFGKKNVVQKWVKQSEYRTIIGQPPEKSFKNQSLGDGYSNRPVEAPVCLILMKRRILRTRTGTRKNFPSLSPRDY
jgi:hypothetical protein